MRRYNCRCGKKRYRDEESAVAAAAADSAAYGEECTAYRCPGGLAWHVTAHGYLPQALRTVGRRLAHELLDRGEIDVAAFLPHRRKRVEEVAAALTAEGVAAFDGSALRAVDRNALRRIVQVGLDEFQRERSP